MSSGLLGAAEAVELLASLLASPLYRRDQNSFLLYPDRDLPSFLERNRIPEAEALRRAAREGPPGGRMTPRSWSGTSTAYCASTATSATPAMWRRRSIVWREHEPWTGSVARDRQALLDLFVDVFGHRTFTGRSGTMYAYEGLGCVYWHMVAKLLLAVQEVTLPRTTSGEACGRLRSSRARPTIEFAAVWASRSRSRDYGAFPSDPYSHTPAHAGAQQPGMTGQVKEEILTRFGELGVRVREGVVGFDPVLLRRDEFLVEPGIYEFFDLAGRPQSLPGASGGPGVLLLPGAGRVLS